MTEFEVKPNGRDPDPEAERRALAATRDYLAGAREVDREIGGAISETMRRVSEEYVDKGTLASESAALRREIAEIKRTLHRYGTILLTIACVIVLAGYKLGELSERVAGLLT